MNDKVQYFITFIRCAMYVTWWCVGLLFFMLLILDAQNLFQ